MRATGSDLTKRATKIKSQPRVVESLASENFPLSCDVGAVSKLLFAVVQIVIRSTSRRSLEIRLSAEFSLKQQAIPAGFASRLLTDKVSHRPLQLLNEELLGLSRVWSRSIMQKNSLTLQALELLLVVS